MVRKVVCVFALIVLLVLPAQAIVVPTQSVYRQGNISASYADIFGGLTLQVGLNDYVFYRCGQYQYCLVVGDIEWRGTRFQADTQTTYYVLDVGSGYQSNYGWDTGDFPTFELDVSDDDFVYSSLGGFPQLDFSLYWPMVFAVLLLAVLFIFSVIRGILGAVR